jgi:hypothetical protein
MGAVYHVIARGNERKAIFRDEPGVNRVFLYSEPLTPRHDNSSYFPVRKGQLKSTVFGLPG